MQWNLLVNRHSFLILGLIFAVTIVLGIESIEPTEAHHKICEICGNNTGYFSRIDYSSFLLKREGVQADDLNNKMLRDRSNYIMERVPEEPRNRLIGDIAQFRVIDGSLIFRNDADAQIVFDEFETWITANQTKYLYSTVSLLNNTHHWSDPEPDEILEFQIIGSRTIINDGIRNQTGR